MNIKYYMSVWDYNTRNNLVSFIHLMVPNDFTQDQNTMRKVI